MALTEKMIELFRENIKDPKLSDEDKKRFKDALDKEGVSYSASETEIVEEEAKTPKPAKAKKKAPTSKKKPQSSESLSKAKADLEAKYKVSVEDCEKLLKEYAEKRAKAKKGREKRTSKLKKDGKLIKGTDVKDAGATLDTAKKKVEEKIKTELKKVEKKEEAKVKTEVNKEKEKQAKTKKPKAKQDKEVKKVEKKEEKKAEKEVKEKTEKVAVKLVVDTSEIISAITKSLANFDKNSSKEYLIKLRDDINKLLSKYDAGGFTQQLNITQSNMSASSVNPFKFKKGGKVNVEKELRKIKEYEEKGGDVEFFGQKYKKRGGDVEFFGQKFMAKGGKTQPMDKKLYDRFNKVMVGYHKDIGIPIKSLMDAYSKGKAPLTREQQNKLTKRLQKEHPQLAEDLGMKYKRGGDIEFFGQKFMAKGGIVKSAYENLLLRGAIGESIREGDKSRKDKDTLNKIYDRLEKKKFDYKKGGDIEFFGNKYKKKGGIVDKFSDAYNDLVKELGFKKKGGDIEFFGNKYKKKGGVVEKFNKAYKDLVKELGFKKGGDVEFFGQDYKRMGGKVRKFKQGYNDRDDEALAMRRGRHKSQDYRARRNESKGELKHKMRRAYSDVDSMDRGNRYLKRGGDVDFFGQKFKKRGGDVDFFGQKYMKKGGETDWIQSVVDSPNFRKGAFTRKAKERGMSTEAFMKQVLSNPNRYDLRTRRQAQFMKNI
jgi:hypothetical protein